MSIFATLAQKEPTIKSMEFITKRSMCDSNRGFTPQTLTLTPIQSHWNHTCRQWAETKWRYLISLFYASIKALCVAVNIALDIISSTAARVNCTQSTTLKKRLISNGIEFAFWNSWHVQTVSSILLAASGVALQFFIPFQYPFSRLDR